MWPFRSRPGLEIIHRLNLLHNIRRGADLAEDRVLRKYAALHNYMWVSALLIQRSFTVGEGHKPLPYGVKPSAEQADTHL